MLEPVLLRLKHPIKGVTIRYTTDGSEPDSVKSPQFDGKAMVDKNMVVKAKAFKQGWISSNVLERSFYKVGFKPDSIALLFPPNPLYKGASKDAVAKYEKGLEKLSKNDAKGALSDFDAAIAACSP